ncbi:winged helix DNA-binding domain-containing protein [Actinomadura yumaensis]|uniref:Winged helix DNA-binding domain-containing protein n=1 Tax=Actinomadura yumaensis TaxID=111807 RepID=A0ABW2CJ24_9ACTN
MTVGPAEARRLSWAQVRARRLAWHGLAEPLKGAGPADVASAMAGTHAQMMSAAELGIALRMDGATRADVREAVWGEHSLIKTFGPRGTVHLLPARELPMWVGALSALPRPSSPHADGVRMAPEQSEQVIAAVGDALRDAELTIDELTEEVVARTGPWAGDLVMPAFQGMWPRWRQSMHEAGIRGLLCFGAGRGRKVTYTSPRRFLPGFAAEEPEAALRGVVRSYLRAYGPSTPQRFAHWLNAPATWASELFASLEAELERVEVEGVDAPQWLAPDASASAFAVPRPRDVAADVPRGVRLLPYFDVYAYRVGNQPPALLYPGRASERVLRGNFQVLLVDGEVAGLWHQRRSGRRIEVTVEPLAPLSRARRSALDDQVARVGEILEARPTLTIGEVTVGGHA